MSEDLNKLGLAVAVLKIDVPYQSGIELTEGKLSILTTLAMAEHLGLKELYDYLNIYFREKTGFHVESQLDLLCNLNRAPMWYKKTVYGLAGIVPESQMLAELVNMGFDIGLIATLVGKYNGETHRAIIANDLWSKYMKHHHSGRGYNNNPRLDEELLALALKGYTLEQMGQEIGTSKQNVSDLLKKRPEIYQIWKERKRK